MQVLSQEQLEGLTGEELLEQLKRLGESQGKEIKVPEEVEDADLVTLYLDSVEVKQPAKDDKKADAKQIKMLVNARFAEGSKLEKKHQVAKDQQLSVGTGGIQKKTADALVKDGMAEWVK